MAGSWASELNRSLPLKRRECLIDLERETMKTPQPDQPRAPHPQSLAPQEAESGANPRNVPAAELDSTPPHPRARKPARSATEGQDDVPLDAEMILDPPPNAPDLRHERING